MKIFNFKENREKMGDAQCKFLAPEIKEHGNSADSPKRDLWSLGVLTYFFFCADFPEFELNGNVKFSQELWDHVSEDAKDFI